MSIALDAADLDPLLVRLSLNFGDEDARLPILLLRLSSAHERRDYTARHQVILEICHLLGITRLAGNVNVVAS